MLKTIKKIFIFLFVITAIAVLGLYLYSLDRTYFNEETLVGNTTGNIYNGGLFSERDGKIYFSNDYDDGSLYVMNSDCSNVKKVHSDKAAYINVDNNYIYYLRANNTRDNSRDSILMFNNTGVYRINHTGGGIKAITSNPAQYLTLRGNYLYYQRYDVKNGLFLYRSKIDANMERLLLEEAVIPADVMDNRLIFAGFTRDHNINGLNLDSFTTTSLYEGNYAYPIFSGDYIYYLDLSDSYSIGRMNRDGTDPTVLVKERCSTYNITNSGKYLYYQVDDGDNNRISRINLQTMENETILEGNYKQIHVTDKYVFFKEFENTHTFVLPADGKISLGTFDPPNLSKE